MTTDLWPSAFVAAVFALHPLRAESVAWVAERKDVLSGLLFMLTLAAYVSYVRRPFSFARYFAVVALFALGLMAKPMLVTLPLVLWLLDFWPLGRIARPGTVNPNGSRNSRAYWRVVLEKLPLLALSAASCVVTALVQSESLAPLESLPFPSRAANAMVSCVSYVVQLFYPAGLAVLYPYPIEGVPVWQVAGAFLLLSVVSAGAVACWRRFPWLLVGWFWYMGMLVPVIGFVQVGVQSMADRYTYLPQIGLTIGVAWTIKHAFEAWPCRNWLCGVTGALAVAVLMGCAWRQTSYWRNSETLWRRAVDCTLQNARAHSNLAIALTRERRADEAISEFRAALKIDPDDPEAHNGFGMVLINRRQVDEAIVHFEKALESRPQYADAHDRLGNALASCGRIDEAMVQFQKAFEANPDYASAHNNLGIVLAGRRRFDEAIAQYRRALEIKPNFAEAYNNLGVAIARRGQDDDAAACFQKALEIKPNYGDARNNLSLARSRREETIKVLPQRQK
jgi:Tfp pilus assembly protein PilF